MVKDLATVDGKLAGKIDPTRVKETVDIMAKYFKLNSPVDPKDVYAEGFAE